MPRTLNPRRAIAAPATDRERGSALIYVLLAMVVLSIISASFMTLSNVEKKVGGHSMRKAQALNIAEAGIAEAITRIRIGDVPNNGNPRMVSQIFLSPAGSVPVLGTDSIALATQQPASDWLAYSMPQRDSRVLEVRYKTNAARTEIYRYDAMKSPAVQTASGMPIFAIRSTGRKGAESRIVESEVVTKPVNAFAKAALAADKGIDFSGNSFVCGYNHQVATPSGTKERGPCLGWEEAGGGHKPGGWSTSTITKKGASTQYGSPAPYVQNQIGFYAGPWEALGMGQAEFFQWVGTARTTELNPPNGIVYLDNNTLTQDRTGTWTYNGGTGEGLLYVDGDLRLNGNFVYRGLIYIEGDLAINGTCWVIGGIIVKGKARIKIANGNCSILYSEETIRQKISRYGGDIINLSWIESN